MPKTITFNKYQRRSPGYHWQQISRNLFWFNAYVAARYQQVIKLIPKKKNQRILDIGCGDGALLGQLSWGRLYGVDLDQSSLAFAATKVKAKLIKAKAESLPFRNNFFDVVVATEIIEHLSRPQLMLAEIRRVLKPGGRVILTTPIKPPQGLTDPLHIREFSPEELNRLCRQYFSKLKIITSHPLWLKRFYSWSAGKIGWYHLDLGRWLVNAAALWLSWNLFINLPGRPSQQLLVGRK